MKKYFVKLMSRLLHSTIHQVMCHFWVFIVKSFSWKSVGFTVGFFLKITSLSWLILSISLDELNSINWLFEELMMNFLGISFYCCKRILIWRKILEIFRRLCLNIIFWIFLWMLTSLVIQNLNVTVSTTLKYCYK